MAINKAKRRAEPEPTVLPGEVPNYEEAGLDDEFVALVSKKVKLAAKRKALKAEESDLRDQLLAVMAAGEHKAVQVGDYRVIYSEGAVRKSLDPKLLMKNGVTAAVILKSTVETKGKPQVTVREAGGAE